MVYGSQEMVKKKVYIFFRLVISNEGKRTRKPNRGAVNAFVVYLRF